MAKWSKGQGSNQHLQNMGSAKFVHLDGSVTTPIVVVPSTKAASLLRVSLNTNGAVIILRTGSRVIAQIATDSPEQVFNYGVWCENGLTAECSGVCSVTIAFDS